MHENKPYRVADRQIITINIHLALQTINVVPNMQKWADFTIENRTCSTSDDKTGRSYWPISAWQTADFSRPILLAVIIGQLHRSSNNLLTTLWHVMTNGGDTQSRNLYRSTCTRNSTVWHGFLHKIFLVQDSCIPYKKLACTWLEWWVWLVGCLSLPLF